MTKVTRKLLLSIFSVVLTVVALGATTFAWFTITNVASVQAFDADFKANQGIEIAIGDMGTGGYDDLNWVTNITADMVYAYINATHLAGGKTSFEFDHVTTHNGIDFRQINSSYGFENVDRTAGYLEIPLHFRSESAEAIILAALNFNTPQRNWRVDVPFVSHLDADDNPVWRNPGANMLVYGHDAIRVGFTAHEATTRTTIFEKPGNIQESGTNHYLGGGEFDLTGQDHGIQGAAGAMNYFYAKNGALPTGTNSVILPETETTLNAVNSEILRLVKFYDDEGAPINPADDPGAAYYGKLTLRIWVEGWDANAYNAILGSVLTVALTFEGKLPTVQG